MPDLAPLASIESANGTVVLDWIKLADDGSGDLIVRAYEAAGGRADATLHVCPALAGASVHETNVLEGDDLAADLPVALQDGAQNAEGAHCTSARSSSPPCVSRDEFSPDASASLYHEGAEVCRITVSPITSLPPLPPDTAKRSSPCFFCPISSWSAATASCNSASNRISTPHSPHAPCVRSTIPANRCPPANF